MVSSIVAWLGFCLDFSVSVVADKLVGHFSFNLTKPESEATHIRHFYVFYYKLRLT